MVMEALQQRVSLTQQVSIDEAFLDVTLDPVPGVQIARELQLLIKERYQLPTSWGIASNKLVAKIASEVGKPEGLIEVKPGQEAQFLQPLPVGMLWGVGPKTQGRLASIGIKRIGELAEAPVEVLRGIFGDRGMELAAKAKGMDSSPVKDEREPKSLSNENTFAEDIQDKGALRRELLRLSDRVASRLRKAGYSGRTVKLKIRWSDFTTMTRQATLQHPTDLDREIFETAWTLFHQVWKGDPVRLLGVGVVDLSPTARQLTLFEREHEREGKLLQALDDIRTRFGRDSVQRADQVSDQGNVEDEVDSQS